MTVEAQRKAIFIYLLSLTDSILVSYFFRTFLCIFQSLLQFLTFIFLFFSSLLYFFVILFLSSVSPYSFLVFPSPLFSYSLYFPHMFLPHSSLSEKFISRRQFLNHLVSYSLVLYMYSYCISFSPILYFRHIFFRFLLNQFLVHLFASSSPLYISHELVCSFEFLFTVHLFSIFCQFQQFPSTIFLLSIHVSLLYYFPSLPIESFSLVFSPLHTSFSSFPYITNSCFRPTTRLTVVVLQYLGLYLFVSFFVIRSI